jgi:hypothetical protein
MASLAKLKTTGSRAQDKILQNILLAVHQSKFLLEAQEDYVWEDEFGLEYDVEEFYGEYEVGKTSLGVTIRKRKKMAGLASRYYIEVETDDETFEVGGEYGARAWKYMAYQLDNKDERIDESKLDALAKLMEL